MLFTVLPPREEPPRNAPGAYLVSDNWNDFGFRTQFWLWCSNGTVQVRIGSVRIASDGLEQGPVPIPGTFDRLGAGYFSLGTDENYYAKLRDEVSEQTRVEVLAALRDSAYDLRIFVDALRQPAMETSLLRELLPETVQQQLHRIAHGGPTQSAFNVRYEQEPDDDGPPVVFDFAVDPDAKPPNNIHALIGSNGVGKTRLLERLASTVLAPRRLPPAKSRLEDRRNHRQHPFTNLVTVSFSAFDPQQPLRPSADVNYTYIGLKHPTGGGTKRYSDLAADFEAAVQECLTGTAARRERWAAALATLEATDALFSDVRIRDLAGDEYLRSGELPNPAVVDLFLSLSSGHKIVLLTLACLVQNTVERTLVLVDEPEAHLHPPLLSALLRALSDLMLDRNGLAVIATHSPVVLQETPSSAVWALRRVGDDVRVDHPEIETFGENVGVITREIFGLEVRRSGFHQLIQDLADEGRSYEEIVLAFRGNLGAEGHALARAAARHFRQQR